ncbi:MAG: class I SAM-dependent methyltransferase [Anaerolineae bacterium]|nr:class I SAM-dependent methyltransferase [Anaerolineae bacterium]
METVSCNLCGSSKQAVLWTGRDWGYGFPGDFCMVGCVECGLIYLNPRPSPQEIGAYYPENYEPYVRTPGARSSWSLWIQRRRLRSRVRAVTRLANGGRLLDLGCGSGGFLREMQRLPGWQVQGIELSQEMAAFGREQLGLEVQAGTLEEARLPDDAFDVVTMWDVLEHLPDPLSALREIHRILKSGGVLISSSPNAASLDARLFGRYWIGLDFPRHLYVFSASTLSAMLRQARLEPEQFFCFYGRYTTFALSLSLWLNAHIRSLAWRRRLRSILLFPLFRYLTLPYFVLLDALNRGAILTVTARKID